MSTSLIVIISLCYIVLLLLVARVAARGGDNSTFFTGGRKMAWGVVAIGMIGAPMSGVSFISVPGSVSSDGFSYMIMVAGFTIGQIVVAFWLIPLLYRLKVTSLYQYLEYRFGEGAHRAGAVLFIASKLSLTALKLYAFLIVTEALLSLTTNLQFAICALMLVLTIWLFTQRGGVKSVVWTDIMQSVVLIAAVVVTIISIGSALEVGTCEIIERVYTSDYSKFIPDNATELARTPIQLFLGGIFILIAMTGLDQDMMQRNLSCSTISGAQKNIITAAIAQAFVIGLLLIMGAMLYIYAEQNSIPITSGDRLYAMIATNDSMPLIVGVLFILGVLSSSLSTAGSALTALTTSYIYDLSGTSEQIKEGELKSKRRVVHLVMALIIALLILLFRAIANQSLISLLFSVVGYLYGPILALFIFGVATKREIKSRLLYVVILAAPIITAAIKYFASQVGYNIGFELIIYNSLLTIAGLYTISRNGEDKI